jgi:hypothetical protein
MGCRQSTIIPKPQDLYATLLKKKSRGANLLMIAKCKNEAGDGLTSPDAGAEHVKEIYRRQFVASQSLLRAR